MEITDFIKTISADKQAALTEWHNIILANDQSVIAVIKPMMGKDMILYEQRGYMKYGLAVTAKHFSLHCLPMYMNPSFHEKFEKLLPKAKFQKGCINFKDSTEMPATALAQVITTCAVVNIAELLEKRKKK